MSVNKITQETIEKIRKNSVMPLPVNASERGLSSNAVKSAIYTPVEMVINELNRVVDEQNVKFDSIPSGVDGKDGKDGVNGKSAYEIAVDNGYRGTEKEWIDSLNGNNVTINSITNAEILKFFS